MKTTWLVLVGLVCVSVAAAQGAPTNVAQGGAAAQTELPSAKADPGPAKIGVLDIQKAIQTSEEGKKMIADLDARFQPKQDELARGNKDLQALQTQLQNGDKTLSDAAKSDLSRQISTKTRDLQQEQQNDEQDLQQSQSDLISEIGGKMMPIINNYAAQHGFVMIVDVSFPWPQNPVLYATPAIDVTADIIRLYDQAHPAAATTPAKPLGPGH